MITIRQQFFAALHRPSPTNALSRYLNYTLAALIVSNCAAVALETVASIFDAHKEFFQTFEAISTAIFAVEYVFRLWVCVEQMRFSKPILGRLKYAVQPLTILDLVVVLTYWAPWDLRFLRIFRLSRLLKLFRFDSLDQSLNSVTRAVSRRKNLLIMSMLMMLITSYCFAALLFMVEHSVQPNKFTSIPETLWWAVVTLTTIGYGDVTPITPLGKLLTGGIVLVGIGIFALPTAIMTASILEAGADKPTKCRHCGNHIE